MTCPVDVPMPEALAINVTVTATPRSEELVVRTAVATPLLFVLGAEVLKLAVTLLWFVVGVARVRVTPETRFVFVSLTVNVMVVVSATEGESSDTLPVPEIVILPNPNVTDVLSVVVPIEALTVAVPAVELERFTVANPVELKIASEAVKVPSDVVKETVLWSMVSDNVAPVNVAVITEISEPFAATVVGLADTVKVSVVEVGVVPLSLFWLVQPGR